MGCCFSVKIKSEIPSHTDVKLTHDNKEEDGSIGGSKKVPQLKIFTFSELKTATRNFRTDAVVGEDGFCGVFRGWFDEQTLTPAKPGTGIDFAVKKLNQEGFLGHNECMTEINLLGQLHHPNIVKLIGYCLEDEHRLLVYEFLPKRSLYDHLFRGIAHGEPLSWNTRMKIALGVAKALAFLHSDRVNVIHRDLKPSAILLDLNFNAKLSNFNLARAGPMGDESHVETRVMGTYGYAAPEYIATGYLTKRCDVYSFGAFLLELMSGRRTMDRNRPAGEHNLVEWAKPYLSSKRRIFKVMDTRIDGQYQVHDAMKVGKITLQCLSLEPQSRPTMVDVVSVLTELQGSGDTGRSSSGNK